MIRKLSFLISAVSLVACSTVPSGPSALVLPGDQKNESQFRADDVACRKFAHSQLESATHAPQSLGEGQLHFDINYLQCMYAKGHLIPVSGEVVADQPSPKPGSTQPVAPEASSSPKG